MGVAIPLESMASINPIPPVNPVGADPRVCPYLGIEPATQRKLLHGGDRGEHIGSPLRGWPGLGPIQAMLPRLRASL
jgi:hypothetical protein